MVFLGLCIVFSYYRMADHTTLSRDNFVERISSITGVETPSSFLAPQNNVVPILEINSNAFHSAQVTATNSSENSYTHPLQSNAHSHQHSATTSSSSYTFLQIKREPCQVSEITTSNHHHKPQEQSNEKQITTESAASSTLTTVVKIESSSPKYQNVSGCGGLNSTAVSTLEKSMYSTFCFF